jgi:hypothetical protein
MTNLPHNPHHQELPEPNADSVRVSIERGDFWFSCLSGDDLYLIRDALLAYEHLIGLVPCSDSTLKSRVLILRMEMQKAAGRRYKAEQIDRSGAGE